MKAQELRVGNIIENGTVIAVHRKYVCVENGDGTMYTVREEDIVPVETTEEILLRAGVQKTNCFKNGDIIVAVGMFDMPHARKRISGFLCEIKYLHQLQNLYFAITGEELQITI